MTNVIQDLSRPVLVKAIEANIQAQLPVMARLELEGVEIYDGQDVKWMISGLAHPLMNAVMSARFRPDETHERVKATLDRFRAQNLPLSWWVGPSSRPADLGDHLQARGLVHASDTAGMAADLLAVNEDVRSPPGLAIERVGDLEAVKKWLQPAVRCFQLPDFWASFFLHASAHQGFGPEVPWLHYVGSLEGEPVACSSLFLGAGVAGVYNVGTVPEARRQGIGTAITIAPLRDARAMGYRVGILHASEQGFDMYRRLGFVEYCTFGVYVWTGEETAPGPT
jgi:ribosomal protein S18 acetylase RimI-like enzyme